MALIFCKGALRRGEIAVFLDWENGHKALYERLGILGVTDDELDNFYPLVFPTLAPQDWESEWREVEFPRKVCCPVPRLGGRGPLPK